MSDTSNEAAAAAKPAGRKRLVMGLLVLALAGAGAGAWAWMNRAPEDATKVRHKAVFIPLEPFTVNLKEPRGDRFAQVGITLESDDPATEALVKDRLPALRNNVLMLLASKQVDELLSVEGKLELAQQVRERANLALSEDAPAAGASAPHHPASTPVRGVLFSQFIVQ